MLLLKKILVRMNLNFFEDIEKNVIGVDEVGRGALCGPVVSSAVLLNKNVLNHDLSKEIDDSKKINEKKRYLLSNFIKKNSIFTFGVSTNIEIDEINILNATILSMKRALEQLNNLDNVIKIDGQKIFNFNKRTIFITKGDQKSAPIAAASILAKCFRDDLLKKLSKKYPNYEWEKNKGYGTKKHLEAIKQFGITEFHRKTFLSKLLNK